MTKENTIVYDPDPTDMQMTTWEQINQENLQTSDLCNPQAVHLLVHIQRWTLAQLKSSQGNESRLQLEKGQLQKEREDLRIENAQLQGGVKSIWLEIPISVLSGFAINVLATNPKDGTGWFMFILSLVMLLFLRGADAKHAFKMVVESTTKGDNNG